MAYTQADLDNVIRERIKLAMGARAVSLTIGDKTISFGESQDKELRDLEHEIRRQLGTTPKSYILTRTDKGL
jgi:hypothetical protein